MASGGWRHNRMARGVALVARPTRMACLSAHLSKVYRPLGVPALSRLRQMMALFWIWLGGAIGSTLTMAVQSDVEWGESIGFFAALFIAWPVLLTWTMGDAIETRRARRRPDARRAKRRAIAERSEAPKEVPSAHPAQQEKA